MNNPFDALDVARDLVRQDECMRLYKVILTEQNMCSTNPTGDEQYDKGVLKGLELALDLIDGQITWLRERWG